MKYVVGMIFDDIVVEPIAFRSPFGARLHEYLRHDLTFFKGPRRIETNGVIMRSLRAGYVFRIDFSREQAFHLNPWMQGLVLRGKTHSSRKAFSLGCKNRLCPSNELQRRILAGVFATNYVLRLVKVRRDFGCGKYDLLPDR